MICSDKTGTLTLHQMTATHAWCGGRTYEIDGLGYGPVGAIDPPDTDTMHRLVTAAALASDAVLRTGPDGVHELVGDPTEGALIVLAGKAGVTAETIRAEWPRLAVRPFDSTRKLMATVTEDPFGGSGRLLAVKGGSDVVFGRCTSLLVPGGIADLDEARSAEIAEVMRALGADGLRVLAIAGRDLAADWDGDPEDELILRGDPASRAFSCLHLRGGRLVAIDCINRGADFLAAKKLIAESRPIDRDQAADPEIRLGAL